MTDEVGKAELHHLRLRVDEIEASNQALWAWVKTLASQDNMLLLIAASRAPGPSQMTSEETERIVNQIVGNSKSLNPSNDAGKDE